MEGLGVEQHSAHEDPVRTVVLGADVDPGLVVEGVDLPILDSPAQLGEPRGLDLGREPLQTPPSTAVSGSRARCQNCCGSNVRVPWK
jgi:hypothetical protein